MLSPRLSNFFLAASTAVLVSAWEPTSRRCGLHSRNSFAIPSWFVQDVAITGTGDTQSVSFSLLNRATNGTTSVACKAGSACSAEDKALETSIEVAANSVQIFVEPDLGVRRQSRGRPVSVLS